VVNANSSPESVPKGKREVLRHSANFDEDNHAWRVETDYLQQLKVTHRARARAAM